MSVSNSNGPDPIERKFLELSEKRLEKFASLFPRVLISDDADTIHDARVWSRRLQQILRILFPKPGNKKSRKLTRRLKKVRRALGPCRNLDVMADLLHAKIENTGNPVARDAWDQLQMHVAGKRRDALARARKKLSRYDIVDFINRAQALLFSVPSSDNAERDLSGSIAQALDDWKQALDNAKQKFEAEQIHRLRIAGKGLRYRVELLAELGDTEAKSQTKALKALQDQLGEWHDRVVLLEIAAEFLAQKDFLASHPDLSRALLIEMERERRRNDAALSNILKAAEKFRDALAQTKMTREIAG